MKTVSKLRRGGRGKASGALTSGTTCRECKNSSCSGCQLGATGSSSNLATAAVLSAAATKLHLVDGEATISIGFKYPSKEKVLIFNLYSIWCNFSLLLPDPVSCRCKEELIVILSIKIFVVF